MQAPEFPAQLARTQRFSLGVPRDFTFSPDGRRALFLRSRGGEDRASCLWLWEEGRERLLAGPGSPGAAGPVPEQEQVRRERARESATGVVAYAADAALRVAVFAEGGRVWVADTASGAVREVPTAGPATDPRPDPTGARVAYLTGGDLRVVRLDDGREELLARADGPEVAWGAAEHVAAESMGRPQGYWWAPDGTRLLAARVDTAPVQRWWIADPADPARPPRQIAYPAAGTANALVSLHVLGAGPPVEIRWDRAEFEYLARAGWDAHGPLLAVQSRDQRTLLVLAADPDTGATTVLHTQRDPAWVQLVPGTPARTGSGALVHTADTADTRRLLVGGEPVTPEGLQVREVLDVTGESVLFTASTEPTRTHLWRHEPGSGPVRLSDGPGLHTGWRGGGTVLIGSRTPAGRTFRILAEGRPEAEIACLDAEPLVAPQVTWVRAGEREIRTALLLPSRRRPGEPLPVLMAPYGGPAMQLATEARHWWLCEAQWFAENGFAVVIADGRGTPGRGPAWEKTVRGDSLSAPLADQAQALRAAAEHCPDLDLGRVAIRGWSYGGTLAAAAVLRMPEVFHAAVAGAPPTDQRLYDTHWRERFLGHPDEEPENYARSSLIADAPGLRRPLLLIHGTADDNVVPAHTLRLSAALLAAGRPHEVLLLPGTHVHTDEATDAGLLRIELEFLRRALEAPAVPLV